MRKILGIIFVIVLIVGAYYGYTRYQYIYSPAVSQEFHLKDFFVKTGTSYQQLKNQLFKEGIIESEKSFEWVANVMKFDQSRIKPGRYILQGGASNYDLISMLRTGNQVPIDVKINNIRFVEQIAGQVGKQIEADSQSILFAIANAAKNKSLNQYSQSLCLFLPNTYEFYWNTSGEEFVSRMINENEKYWNSGDRLAKALRINLSTEEVYTLASIVEKETNANEEKARIAGVYLNRLKNGIPLQADPTVVYANGDFTIKRVLNRHLEYKSPYNTYLNPGLPPGPICMPSLSSLEAVLNAEKHNYFFFCAKPDSSGKHAFASTLSEHNRNARKFHNWLNSQGIR